MDFTGNMDVMPVSDPNITSKAEKVAVAKEVLQLTDPNNAQAMFEAKKEYFKALGKDESEIMLLNPPPPPPPDLPAIEENAMFLREQYVEPLQHQDHIEHIVKHRAFEISPIAEEFLTPNGKNLNTRHMQVHASMQYMVENQAAMQKEQQKMQMQQGQPGGVE